MSLTARDHSSRGRLLRDLSSPVDFRLRDVVGDAASADVDSVGSTGYSMVSVGSFFLDERASHAFKASIQSRVFIKLSLTKDLNIRSDSRCSTLFCVETRGPLAIAAHVLQNQHTYDRLRG